MTTLPQTTNPRLPVRGGPAPVPAASGANAMHLATPSTMTGGDVWRVIRANVWTIALIMILAIGGGIALNQFVLKPYFPRYESTGLVQVTLNKSMNPTMVEEEGDDPGRIGLETRTQAASMKSPGILTDFLTNNTEIPATDWYKKFQIRNASGGMILDIAKAKEALEDSLSVYALPETKIVQVTMTAANASDARTLVYELVNNFLRIQSNFKNNRTQARSADLNKLKTALQMKLNTINDDLHRFQADLSKAGYKSSIGYGQSQKEVELIELLRKQMDSQSDLADAQQMVQSMNEAIQQGQTPPLVEGQMGQDQRVLQSRMSVDNAKSYLEVTESMLGKGHPQYTRAKTQSDVAERQLADAEAEFRARMTGEMQSRIQSMVQSADTKLQGITSRINDIRSELGELDYKMLQAMVLQDNQKAIGDQLKDVDEQVRLIASTGDTRTGLDWAVLPETPQMPSFPKLWLTVSAAAGIGLMLSLGLAFLREMLDTSVRSPRDIARIGQLPILGMIQHEEDDPQVTGVPLALVIYQAPTSIIAEQFRQVRSRLQHSTSLDSTRTLLVTSPSPADGKSTVAANLAAGLALNGRRILLVDANFRRPELHKIFNVNNDMGFSSVFASIENLATATKQTSIPNLDLLTTGPKPANATELLESSLFSDFVDKALLEYDHIVFDSGPMLFVSETAAMAPRVDGVVTVVRAAANSRGLLQRLRDQLKGLKAEHLGVVLNAVRAQGGGYYGRNIKTYYEYSNGHKN